MKKPSIYHTALQEITKKKRRSKAKPMREKDSCITTNSSLYLSQAVYQSGLRELAEQEVESRSVTNGLAGQVENLKTSNIKPKV